MAVCCESWGQSPTDGAICPLNQPLALHPCSEDVPRRVRLVQQRRPTRPPPFSLGLHLALSLTLSWRGSREAGGTRCVSTCG